MKKIIFIVGVFTLIISVMVIIGWFFQITFLLSIIPGAATMKFNTAGLFLLLSLGVLNMLYTRNEYSVFDKIVSFSLIFIGSITLLEYTLAPNFTIDKLFIEDEITDTFPGRMSGATAFCFVLLGFALNGIYSKKVFITKLTQYVLLVVLLISLISIEAFILQIPSVKRIFFLNSMALHTSLLFIFTSIALALQNPTAGFMGLLTGHLLGSRIIVKSLFILVLTPLILSFCWLIVTNEGWMEKDFGIAVYTVLLLLIFLVFIGNLATKLNHLDLERNVLENALLDANQELTYFKQGLDESFSVAKSNARGKLHYVNDNLCKATASTRNELIGRNYKDLIAPSYPAHFYTDILEELLSGRIWKGEIQLRGEEERTWWSQVIIVPYKNQKGNIYQHLYIAQDISTRKRNEVLMTKYVLEIEQKNKELDDYGHITSHDLQEPLRTIVAFIDVFKGEYSSILNTNASLLLNYIEQSAERMRMLISGLLEHANIGQFITHEPIDCNALLENITHDLSSILERNKVILKVDKLPEIIGNPVEIRSLFQNLITNAIKFRKPDTQPIVNIQGEDIDNGWQFSISDNGIGISTKNLDKIFTMFSRLHHSDQYEGLGIGLAHAQKIVKTHGGKMSVESKINQGSTFSFTISKRKIYE